jgi:Ca2+-binding RTX toxin-like protein
VQDGAAGNTLALVGTFECVIGTQLDDEIIGNAAANILRGGDGNDVLRGGGGNDQLHGEDGDDLLLGEAGNDILSGGDGNDIASGGAGVDNLIGDAGFDFLLGGADFDMLDAKDGDNLVVSGRTVFDNDHAALLAILAEWTSGRDLAVRIANLTDGSGSADRENEDFFLTFGPGGTLLAGDPVNMIYAGPNNWLRTQPRDVIMRR